MLIMATISNNSGSSLDIVEVNIRGNILRLHNNKTNKIFEISKRLSQYIKEKQTNPLDSIAAIFVNLYFFDLSTI